MVSSCTTGNSRYDISIPPVIVEEARTEDIRYFGFNYDVNPYMEIKSLLRGWVTEIHIVKIQLNLPIESSIIVIAEMKDKNGKLVAQGMDETALTKFWEENTDRDLIDAEKYIKKISNIRRSAIPDYNFIQKPGRETYYIPFTKYRPTPRPVSIQVQIISERSEPVIFQKYLE